MTRAEFEALRFYPLTMVVDVVVASGVCRKTALRWLHRSAVVTRVAGGRGIVTRAALDAHLPPLVDALRQACVGCGGLLPSPRRHSRTLRDGDPYRT